MRAGLVEGKLAARNPIRGIFVRLLRLGWEAKRKEHRRIAQSYRVSAYSFLLTPSAFRLTAGCACFVPEPGQNIHLPLSDKKQAGLVQLSESSVEKTSKAEKI